MDNRESQLVSLVKELLGPRDGIDETVFSDPRKDYITGVLQPATFNPKDNMPQHYWLPDYAREQDKSNDEYENEDEDLEDGLSFTSKSLSPLLLPSSIGISFFVKTDSVVFDLCATWARYRCIDKDADGKCKKWSRAPHIHLEKGVSVDKDEKRKLYTSTDGVEIQFMSRKVGGGLHVSIYIRNNSKFSYFPKADDHLFQPQLRINLNDYSALKDINIRTMTNEPEDSRNTLIYSDRPTLAKGHMCGAVWKEIDAERSFEGKLPESLIPDDIKEDAFVKAGLAKAESNLFVNPNLRTDFLPSYAMKQSSAGHKELGLDEKYLNSKHLAEGFSSQDMIAGLDILKKKYGDWVSLQKTGKQYAGLDAQMKSIADGNIAKCSESVDRIDGGIRMIEKDQKVRLAFCFMNKAMQLQSEWGRGRPMTWKPFQMAFILQCIRGIADRKHPEREICDLLWFPTGGGKTEAYLGLLVFCLALRRLGAEKNGDLRAYGTTVITRYTLRLLTIQQFRRTLSTVTACEYLRSINWDPTSSRDGHTLTGDYTTILDPTKAKVWGSMRFSIGMWVGNQVTPPTITDSVYFDRNAHPPVNKRALGAASLLMHKQDETPPSGEEYENVESQPAQVMNCPCCSAILSIPKVGIDEDDHELFLTIRCNKKPHLPQTDLNYAGINITEHHVHALPANNYYILHLKFQAKLGSNGDNTISAWWKSFLKSKLDADLACASADKPGYFIMRTQKSGVTPREPFDVEIRCPNPKCSLNDHTWDEYVMSSESKHGGKTTSNANIYSHIPDAFKIPKRDSAIGMPIPAYLTDSQIYNRCPSVIIGTVDKFARMPFKPESSAIFGNVDRLDDMWGFHREKSPPDYGQSKAVGKIYRVPGFNPPDLVIQDELHLIEGPLGSMTGLYEAAIDTLCSTDGSGPKYITSTATTRNAESQVRSLYCRELRQFPPHSITSSDNFFSKSVEAHQLDEKPAGRLYVGVCSPGRGAISPTIRIWSSLLQNAEHMKQKNGGTIDQDLDFYWSVVGYFNATRELANFRSAYVADVRQQVKIIADRYRIGERILDDSNLIELHSNMVDKKEISSVLKRLEKQQIDSILATSMFGTGVDIDRLSQMVVHGQPKTTSSYIQSTGRVGRRRGAIVVTFLRSTRPRDLDHYEFFTGYHRAINKFVEPITVYPFSPRAVDRGILPVFITILRNAKNVNGFAVPEKWYPEERYQYPYSGCREMTDPVRQSNREIQNIISILEQRNSKQPKYRQQKQDDVTKEIQAILTKWSVTNKNSARSNEPDLFYNEVAWGKVPKYSVVMGDDSHKQDPNLRCVKENTPQSMRNVESHTRFNVE